LGGWDEGVMAPQTKNGKIVVQELGMRMNAICARGKDGQPGKGRRGNAWYDNPGGNQDGRREATERKTAQRTGPLRGVQDTARNTIWGPLQNGTGGKKMVSGGRVWQQQVG